MSNKTNKTSQILEISFDDALDNYAEKLKIDAKADPTISSYICNVRGFLSYLPALKVKKLVKIEACHILFYKHYKLSVCDESSVNEIIKSIRLFMSFLFANRHIAVDVSQNIKTEYSADERMRPALTELEIKNLFSEILKTKYKRKGVVWSVMLIVLLTSAMRRDDIARFKRSWFDFDSEVINVENGKGKKDRTVWLPTLTTKLLQEFIVWDNVESLNDPIFSSYEGKKKHFNKDSLSILFRRLMDNASVNQDCTLHSTRRTFATFLFSIGINIFVIQRLLSHEDILTTLKYIDYDKAKALIALAENNSFNEVTEAILKKLKEENDNEKNN